MNYRISTGMMYQRSISTMLAKQAQLAHTQQQLSSGQKLVSAKDDPVAAGTRSSRGARRARKSFSVRPASPAYPSETRRSTWAVKDGE